MNVSGLDEKGWVILRSYSYGFSESQKILRYLFKNYGEENIRKAAELLREEKQTEKERWKI